MDDTRDDAIARLERVINSRHRDSSRALLEHLAAWGASGIEETVQELAEQAIENEG